MEKWRVLGVVAGLCVVLGACDSSPPPVVTESPTGPATVSPSPSLTASPSPSPTVLTSAELLALLPANAGEADVEGAVVTAEFFLEQYAPMFHSGDTRVWDALSGPGCTYCTDASSNAKEVAQLGWVATGGEIAPDTSTQRGVLDGAERAVVKFHASFADAYLTKDSGAPELQEAASTHEVFVELARSDGIWVVTGVMIDE